MNPFEPIRAVALDLDDTLWDIERVIVRAEQALYDWLAQHFPRITERHSPAAMRERRIAVGAEHPDLHYDLSALRRRALHWHARDAGYPTAPVERGFDIFFAARNRVDLYADVRPALATLARRYPLVALTNGNADLDAIGIGGFFATTVYAAEVRASKPDAAMFRAAATRLGLAPARLLHVGDDPVSDVDGARGAGATAVWINRKRLVWPQRLAPPAHEVADLRELLVLLGLGTGAA